MADVSKRRLVFSILSFLNDEMQSGALPEEAVESLEVAQQCLENVYNVSLTNPEDRTSLYSPTALADLFAAANPAPPTPSVSDEDRAKAEKLKNEGNDLMKVECFEDAVAKYTHAVQVDPTNAVYYSNRAAAHSKLGRHSDAIEDCKAALNIDPNYSKAYGRMGLAYNEMQAYDQAIHSYETALKLDPDNESYKNNLKVAQELSRKKQSTPTGPTLGGMDLNALASGGGLGGVLNNPQFMNMATQLMSNPEIMNAFTSAMQGGGGGGGPDAGPGGAGGPNMNSLLEMGQRLAEQIEQEDPEKVAQLRAQFQRGPGGPDGPGGPGPDGGPDNPPGSSV